MKQFLLCFFFTGSLLIAQVPDSDIWIFELGKTEKGIILKQGYNATNQPGYDNQPYFTPDNRFMLFTSIRGGVQSDIYKLDLRSRKISQVTQTEISEYSPSVTPDGKFVSVVVVETDSAQHLRKFIYVSKDNKGTVKQQDEQLVGFNLDSVGYYAWLNTDTVLYYKLTQPHSLWIYSVSDSGDVFFADDPSRSFKLCGYKSFFYHIKHKDKNQLRKYDWRIRQSLIITEHDVDTEDFVWNKSLGFLKSDFSKLMRWDAETAMWLELAELNSFGIRKITRFAFSENGRWLAVVSNKE